MNMIASTAARRPLWRRLFGFRRNAAVPASTVDPKVNYDLGLVDQDFGPAEAANHHPHVVAIKALSFGSKRR